MELILLGIFITVLSFGAHKLIYHTISIHRNKKRLELMDLYKEADVDFYNRMFKKPDLYYEICDQAYYESQMGIPVNEVLAKYVWH